MKKTTLVIMAAGMGSRFGGPKQITPVGPSGEKIIDYSVYDAIRAGFNEIIFVLSKALKDEFIEVVGKKIEKHISVKYVIQDINNIPEGYSVPEGRVKPWGTGHAILSCIDVLDAPFMIINADDFYGKEPFKILHDYLNTIDESNPTLQLAMAGYKLKNTVTENGSVSRGICTADTDGNLSSIVERTKIFYSDGELYFEENGEKFPVSPESVTSMNCWGMDLRIMKEFEDRFKVFLQNLDNPQKGEFFLPAVVDQLIKENKAFSKVLTTSEKWYGLTYKEDKDEVVKAIKGLTEKGIYPEKLWD